MRSGYACVGGRLCVLLLILAAAFGCGERQETDDFGTTPQGSHDHANLRGPDGASRTRDVDGIARESDAVSRGMKWTELAQVKLQAGDREQALVYLRSALGLLKKAHDTEPMQASTHELIALVLTDLGRHDEALAEAQQALTLFARTPGTEAQRRQMQELIEKAKAESQTSSDHLPRTRDSSDEQEWLRVPHGFTAMRLVKQGMEQLRARDWEQSFGSFEKALPLIQKGTNTPRLQASVHQSMALALVGLGRSSQAVEAAESALAILIGVPGTEEQQSICVRLIEEAKSSDTVETRAEQEYIKGADLLEAGQAMAAVGHLRKALVLWRTVPDSELWQAKCLVTLGSGYILDEQYEEAIPELLKAEALLERLPAGRSEGDRTLCRESLALARRMKGTKKDMKAEQTIAGWSEAQTQKAVKAAKIRYGYHPVLTSKRFDTKDWTRPDWLK